MTIDKLAAGALASIAVLVTARCAGVQPSAREIHSVGDLAVAVPAIDSVQPDSVLVPYGAAVEVTLYGNAFASGDPGQNTVHFDRMVLRKIAASTDGRRVVFVIPDMLTSGGGAPPVRLESGAYNVSVETSHGTSNAVTLRVYR